VCPTPASRRCALLLSSADGDAVAKGVVSTLRAAALEEGDVDELDASSTRALFADDEVVDEILAVFEPDILTLCMSRGWPTQPFLMCSCSLACMKELARCSTMQWRAGPAAAEPAAEKHKQGLAKPRRPDRLAAMLPPDRAAWSTPPLPPSTGIPSSPTTARAAVSSSAVNALQATAMLPAAARRRGRAVARGGTLRLVGARVVCLCVCMPGWKRARPRRPPTATRDRARTFDTERGDAGRREPQATLQATHRAELGGCDRSREMDLVCYYRVLRIFAFSILLCGCVGARVRVSCLSLTSPSLL
jgi:hypothetical protein